MMNQDDDVDLPALRRSAEKLALQTAIVMMAAESTPATARVSAVRAVLGDATQRRHDEAFGGKQPSDMTAGELQRALQIGEARLAALRGEIEDAELISVSGGVFD